MSDEAVPSFMSACRADATKILKAHWAAVTAVATALDDRKTLSGVEIDTIIFAAESKAMHQVELRRRGCMAAMIANAKSK
jgi:ATP-dependent Zn protease